MNLPRVYTCSPSWIPLPPPSPSHPSGSSQCTSPKHPVSCIEPGLAIHFLYYIIHVSMPFSQIIHPSLSHRVQKSFVNKMHWSLQTPSWTTEEKTLHIDITRWSTPKSDLLYSLQPKTEKPYTVNKKKTRGDCGSDHELLIAKFRLKLKKVWKNIRQSGMT